MSEKLKFSRLGSVGNSEYKSWNNIVLSPTTVAQRKQLKQSMDDFTSFSWRGVNAFDVFGAFIINQHSLKFYNGPSFSNEYTKPQFESAAGQLVGVSFSVQKVDFTIGVYWISEEDYRKMMDWLNPYEISSLTFGFEKDYYYLVKLASVGESIRHIVGTENVNGKKEYRYYTELRLTFELQGEPCAYRKIEYEWSGTNVTIDTPYEYEYVLNNNITDNDFTSHLAMPFKYKMHIKLGANSSSISPNLSLECNTYYNGFLDTRLFKVTFQNLSYSDLNPGSEGSYYLDLVYDSATGLLYWDRNDSKLFLLSRLSTASSGSRLVDSLESTSYKVLGTFDDWSFDLKKWKMKLTLDCDNLENPQLNSEENFYIEMRARTNLI